jgi:hypothetical protein
MDKLEGVLSSPNFKFLMGFLILAMLLGQISMLSTVYLLRGAIQECTAAISELRVVTNSNKCLTLEVRHDAKRPESSID